jgi:hypothetical protein
MRHREEKWQGTEDIITFDYNLPISDKTLVYI